MFSQNLKFLRSSAGQSQQGLASELGIPRTTLSGWERGSAEPDSKMLVTLARKFNKTVDELLTIPLSMETNPSEITGVPRVLSITVDSSARKNIELVDVKAEAGYVENFQEPQFIKELPKLFLPNLRQGTYRAFEIQGDSMLPLAPGSIVVCEYTEKLSDLRSGKTYVVITKPDGIVYKRIVLPENQGEIQLVSDNPVYPPVTISIQDVAEVWQYRCHISFSDPKLVFDDYHDQRLDEMHRKVEAIFNRL